MVTSGTISQHQIKAASGKYDVENVFMLSISNANISDIGDVRKCTNLLDLDLHNNNLINLSGLGECKKIERLNISGNSLTSLAWMKNMPTLSYVHMQGNKVSELAELEYIRSLPNIKALYLQNIDGSRANPVCKIEGYKEFVRTLSPSLDIVDGERLRLRNSFYNLTTTSSASFSPPSLPSQVLNQNHQDVQNWFEDEGESVAREGEQADPACDEEFEKELTSVCANLQDELNTCRDALADVDMFLRIRGVDMKTKSTK